MATGQPNLLLKEARENIGLTQPEIAERVGVDDATYYGWEHGNHIPYLRHRRKLAETLNMSMAEVNTLFGNEGSLSGTIKLKDASYESEAVNEYLQGNLGQRLLGIVDAGPYTDQRKAFTQITEQFDAMNTENLHYQMTRREAIRDLAVLPFAPPINLQKRDRVSSLHYDLFLKECGASLAAVDELRYSKNPDDLTFAFQCVSRYLVELKVIANSSSRYRQQALELAAHCAIRRKSLGWARTSRAANLLFAQDAVDLALESSNICLILSAHCHQAHEYLDNNQRKLALDTSLAARNLLERHEKQKGRLPAHIRGGTQSTLSNMQARNGLSFDTALKKAGEEDPGNEDPYRMLYTRVWVWMDQGATLYYAGKTAEALRAYEQLVDPDTLATREPFKETLTETWRIKTILGMAQASMKGTARDKGSAIRYWEEAIGGVKKLKHESLYDRALRAHDEMDLVFPDEQEVHNLLDHIRPAKGLAQ